LILLLCIVLALGLRVASGGSIGSLGQVRLRGETVLLSLLAVQLGTPSLALQGVGARIAFYAWFATFPIMAGVAWLNRRQPGMALIGAGLALNALVILANGGMPVSAQAVAAISGGAGVVAPAAGDFVHIALVPASVVPILADVIPVPGPLGLASVASPGDCLLIAGVMAAVAALDSRMGSPARG
jgi:hypothetical protein